MPTRSHSDGIRRAVAIARSLAEDVRRLREDASISQRALARASGVAQSVISRLEAGAEVPSIETYARLATALGADLAMRLYPNTGPAIRDRHQARILESLIKGLHSRWTAWPEVGVRQPVRGWIDVVLVDQEARLAIATEIESHVRRLEQVIRWSSAKADALESCRPWPFDMDDGPPGVDRLLIVRDTRANRDVVAMFAGTLRSAYPADSWQARAALRGETSWPGASVLWASDGPNGRVDLGATPRNARPDVGTTIPMGPPPCARPDLGTPARP